MYKNIESELQFSNNRLGYYSNAPALKDRGIEDIPDVWEKKLTLDLKDTSDALEYTSECEDYLNIERYINGLVTK
jgi:transcription elongation factor GreA-like protein